MKEFNKEILTLQPVGFTGLYLKRRPAGDFGGGTVQVIPHITNGLKSGFSTAVFQKLPRSAIIEVRWNSW